MAVPRQRPDLTDLGRRVLAAGVLAGLDQAAIAGELRISTKTLQRSLAGKREFKDHEVQLLVALLPVPEWFLREGFEGLAPASDDELVRALDRKLDAEVIPRLDALSSDVRELSREERARSTESE